MFCSVQKKYIEPNKVRLLPIYSLKIMFKGFEIVVRLFASLFLRSLLPSPGGPFNPEKAESSCMKARLGAARPERSRPVVSIAVGSGGELLF